MFPCSVHLHSLLISHTTVDANNHNDYQTKKSYVNIMIIILLLLFF